MTALTAQQLAAQFLAARRAKHLDFTMTAPVGDPPADPSRRSSRRPAAGRPEAGDRLEGEGSGVGEQGEGQQDGGR
jgi:hypothetical protein